MWFKVIIALLAADCLASPHPQHVGLHRRDDAIKVAEQASSVGPAKISSFVTSAMAPLSITAAEVAPTAAVGIDVPVSLRDEILTAVPPTILLSLMYDDYRTSVRSDFHAGHTPAWYESIKPEVKSFFEAYAKHSTSLVTTATTTETGLPTLPAENSEATSTPKATGTATATDTVGSSPSQTGAATSSGSKATSGVSSANPTSSKSTGSSNAGTTKSGAASQVTTSAASTSSKKTTSRKGAAAVATGGSDADSVVNEVQLPSVTSSGSSSKPNESAAPESDSKESVAGFEASEDNETSAPDGSDSKIAATGVEHSSSDSTGSPYSKDYDTPDSDSSKSDSLHSHDTFSSEASDTQAPSADTTDSARANGTQAPSSDSTDSATSHRFDTSDDSDKSNSPSNATPSAGSDKDGSFSVQTAEDAAQSTSGSGFFHDSESSFTVSSAAWVSTERSHATSAPDDADPADSSAASPTPSSSSSSKEGGEVVEAAVAGAVSINASRWTVAFAMGMAGFLGVVMVL